MARALRVTDLTGSYEDFPSFDRTRLSRRRRPAIIGRSVALAIALLVGAMDAQPAAPPRFDEARAAAPTPVIAANPYAALFDPAYSLGAPSVSFGQNAGLASTFGPGPSAPPVTIAALDPVPPPAATVPVVAELIESIPMPVQRPAELRPRPNDGVVQAPAREITRQARRADRPTIPADNRNFFEKLFGMSRPSGPVLGYAAPEDGLFGNARRLMSNPVIPGNRSTAVYDISAHMVIMPNGARLEAHSGLGDRLDDPNFVHERMRGPTPPHVYDLALREQLFHGVRALRLNPVGGGGVFGRTGLLAHTYMLGPNGDSNGCVSIKDYDAFLQAYLNGEVKRLVVVARQG